MLEGDEAYHWVLSFFPKSARARLNDTLLRADARMGKWLVGQGGLMLILGLCSLIVFVLLKIRYAYALAVLMGVLNIIPIVGAMVSMALGLLAAATDYWKKMAAVAFSFPSLSQVVTPIPPPPSLPTTPCRVPRRGCRCGCAGAGVVRGASSPFLLGRLPGALQGPGDIYCGVHRVGTVLPGIDAFPHRQHSLGPVPGGFGHYAGLLRRE